MTSLLEVDPATAGGSGESEPSFNIHDLSPTESAPDVSNQLEGVTLGIRLTPMLIEVNLSGARRRMI
jgi:hypothetical protein